MPARRPRDLAAIRHLRDQLADDIDAGRLDVGTAVKRMREISGLTQEQFAKHRGVSILTLKRIESGRGNPTVETLNRIGQIFALRVGFIPMRPTSPP
jgi:DNA-binding XRE family transcriptional regulator